MCDVLEESLKPRNRQYIKELLSTLTIDERCGVMLEFEYACPDNFAQLLTDVPSGLNGWRDLSGTDRDR